MGINGLAPKLTYIHIAKTAVKFTGRCLEQDKTTYAYRNKVNFLLFMN